MLGSGESYCVTYNTLSVLRGYPQMNHAYIHAVNEMPHLLRVGEVSQKYSTSQANGLPYSNVPLRQRDTLLELGCKSR